MMSPRCLWKTLLCRHWVWGSPSPCRKAAVGSLTYLGVLHCKNSAAPTASVLLCAKQTICTGRGVLQERDKRVAVQSRSDGASPQTATQKGALFYVVFKELFSSSSPSKIYGEALNKCRSHPEVVAAFGEPIKGYGETTRRGRRQHVSHIEYVKDGMKCMRLKFYIEGSEPRKQGTVHIEVKENLARQIRISVHLH
ncbi:hypothetical protein GDO86_011164 [Hymenochirus boettgeri]|uniref:Mitochondrial import inner membrane translocase subunit Tim21 n=1 Tax=Hymenochirus boettgeri TaxID=247094 RepID=A0A8T2JFA5_9PIPI|nr:hypothetical protein GDO86_011164 [Hymenochirus boettgeri]